MPHTFPITICCPLQRTVHALHPYNVTVKTLASTFPFWSIVLSSYHLISHDAPSDSWFKIRDFLPIHGIHDDDDDDCYYSYIFSSLFEKGRPKRPQSFLFGKFNFRIFNFSLSFSFTFKMSLCENSMSRTTQQHNKNNNNHNNEDINTSDYNARIRSKSQSIRVSVWALDAIYIVYMRDQD